jgi:anti-anti-sigma factor
MSASELSIHREPDRAVLTLVGEHEGYAARKLEQELTGLLDEGYRVEVDLTRAQFIDSEVAAVLVAARKRAGSEDGNLAVVVGDDTGWAVLRLLDLTGLTSMLGVVRRLGNREAAENR